MSLRDLSTTSLCAAPDTGTSSVGAASSSANPLARLAEAVLPSASQPSNRPNPASTGGINSDPYVRKKPSQSSYSDARLIHASLEDHRQTFTPEHASHGITQHAPHAFLQQYLPQAMPVAPLPPLSVPAPMALPPVPYPEIGAPTDLFERAFDSASKTSSASVRSTLPHPPPSSFLSGPRHMPPPAQLNPFMYHSLHSRVARPSWRMDSAMSALSLYRTNTPTASIAAPASIQPPPIQPESANNTASATIASPSVSSAHSDALRALQTPLESQASTEVQKNDHILPTSPSWGEDFTSLEALSLGMEQQQQPASEIDDYLLDDTLQRAFEQWMCREPMDKYQFAERQYSSPRQRALQALKEGVRAHSDGRLSTAVFHLEDALNRSEEGGSLPKEKRALAWYVLGLSLADLDDDERSIQALNEGLKSYDGVEVGHRREDNPYMWHSLIALSVGYTNELEYTKALRCIREWLVLRNASKTGDSEAGIASVLPNVDLFRKNGHDDLLDELNNLASEAPSDVDVFTVIGILHNLNRDYEPAAVALRHAVTLRPSMPNLWNKLGATLANGGNSDDALRSYRKAVDLQPKLVRAWVNVGTAYANRGEYSKAMRYYLKAISISENEELDSNTANSSAVTGQSDSSLHVWGYVRNTLLSMSRADLLHLVEIQDVKSLKAHLGF